MVETHYTSSAANLEVGLNTRCSINNTGQQKNCFSRAKNILTVLGNFDELIGGTIFENLEF